MKNLRITVNGTVYDVQVEEVNGSAAPAPQAAAPQAPQPAVPQTAAPTPPPAEQSGGDPITSPMPGVIVSVNVTTGQRVKSGDILVILEAMKMENEIVAPRDGVVGSISVAQNDSVDTGSALMMLI